MSFFGDNNLKALCFDIDGTLYPIGMMRKYLILSALNHPIFSLRYNMMRKKMRKADGLGEGPVLSAEEFRKKEISFLFPSGCDSYDDIYRTRLYEPWQKYSSSIRPYAGVRETLLEAKGKGCILAALSDFPIGHKLEYLGLDDIFDYAWSTEEFGYLKPNVTPLREMCRLLSINPSEALYVGDSVKKDILGGKNAGMRTMLVRSGKEGRGDGGADLVLRDWHDFIDMVF